MWLYLFCIIFFQLYVSPSSSTTCETTLIYKYVLIPKLHGGPFGHKFQGCSFFNRAQFGQITESEIITCSNVSFTTDFNFTYETKTYPQDLVIVNSTLPKIPSNTSLTKFTNIRKLILRNLTIQDISPEAFKTVESVDLSFNKLENIPRNIFNNPSTLKVLDLSYNRINNVDRKNISSYAQLKKLFLNGNQITILQDGIFTDLINLETLDISNNPLNEFKNADFKNLKTLLLKNTPLKVFDVDLSKFIISNNNCDLSNNSLEMINFNNFPSLDKIDVSYNQLKTLQNFDKLRSKQVFLNNNNISKIEVFPSDVQELDLSHNQIEILEIEQFRQNSSLRVLNLNFNQISSIVPGVFSNFDNLTILTLQHNQIKKLHENTFANLENLREIDLSYNEINYIEKNAFNNLTQLITLNISHNNLVEINCLMFSNHNTLKYLYINHNQIVEFPVDEHHFNTLKKVAINNNLWSCDSLVNILNWLSDQKVDIIDKSSNQKNTRDGITCVNKLS